MRLINADALKYEPLPKGERNYRTYNLDDAYEDGYHDAMVDIWNAPTIEERKTGKWVWSDEDASWKCGSCDCVFEEYDWKPEYNYCPNCGADMRGEQDESD